MQRKLERSLAFATKKHEGQYRIGGEEFITHPIAVYELVKRQGYGIEYQMTALFHDLLEDTDATQEEIKAIGGTQVLHAVKLLTKKKGYDIATYIEGIKSDPIAFAIKKADRLHNLLCAKQTSESFRRKYIAETERWYADFSSEIADALDELKMTLEE